MTEEQEKFEVTDRRFQARTPDREFLPAKGVGPMEIMMQAVQRGMGKDQLEVIERMFDFDLKVKAQQAKEAFYQAKADFKAEVPTVIKDKENTQYKSMYATEDALFNTVNPVLAKHGLEASFSYPKSDDPKLFIARCTLTHILGHSEYVDADGPLDTSGSKNALQQYKSTRTYLKKEAYTAVTGIASADPGDDDGQSAGGKVPEFINTDQKIVIDDRIKEIYADKGKLFFKWLSGKAKHKIESSKDIPAIWYQDAQEGLDKAEAKKKEVKPKREPGSDDK